jgi:hypothetical protein
VGWAASVYVADAVPADLAGWGEPVAQAQDIDGGTSFDLGGAEGSHVLLWFTDLGEPNRPGDFRMEVSELRLAG